MSIKYCLLNLTEKKKKAVPFYYYTFHTNPFKTVEKLYLLQNFLSILLFFAVFLLGFLPVILLSHQYL